MSCRRAHRAGGAGATSLVIEVPATTVTFCSTSFGGGFRFWVSSGPEIASVALERGIPTLSRFFGASLGAELAGHGRRADVLVGNNVLAHVPDLKRISGRASTRCSSHPDWPSSKFPYLKALLDDVEFDTIYHEHQCYFSVTALRRIAARQGWRCATSSAMRFMVARCGYRWPTPVPVSRPSG